MNCCRFPTSTPSSCAASSSSASHLVCATVVLGWSWADADHVAAGRLGRVYVESGFKLTSNPDTVRGPDVAIIRETRLPEPEPVGYPALAPDLVVEILSPSDRPGDVLGKVADWLSADTRLVWVIDPERRLVRIYRADGADEVVTLEQALNGEDVVPGFACQLATIL